MTLTLMDDTVITVELYPDKEILPSKTKREILKDRIEENIELIYVVIALCIVEVIMLIFKLVNLIRRKRFKGRPMRRSGNLI